MTRPAPDRPPDETSPAFSQAGNLLCLDLVNTEVILHGARTDRLQTFSELMRWARAFAVVTGDEERLAVEAWGSGRQATRALDAARALRGALRSMAEALAAGRTVPEEVVTAINDALAQGASVLRLERHGRTFTTTRHVLDRAASTVLAPVAESAAWLLERGDHAQVRKCENPACIQFFYDTTKNKRRRWCSMEACGSRAKAAAYYRRTRAATRRKR
jgi:predicted RNA-binding Zn ribbon-like protein